jgi:hypothetical protein
MEAPSLQNRTTWQSDTPFRQMTEGKIVESWLHNVVAKRMKCYHTVRGINSITRTA